MLIWGRLQSSNRFTQIWSFRLFTGGDVEVTSKVWKLFCMCIKTGGWKRLMKEGTGTSNKNRFRHFCRTPAAVFFKNFSTSLYRKCRNVSEHNDRVWQETLSLHLLLLLDSQEVPKLWEEKKKSRLETQTVNCALRTSSGSDFTSSSSRQTNKQTNLEN